MICIYKITNLKNNKIYIGSTKDFDRRKSEHIQGITQNNHENKFIKSDSLIYGVNDFEFSVISSFEKIDYNWLRLIEQIWVDYLKYHVELYNINLNTLGFGVKYHFPNRKDKIEYRKIAKIEKQKANNFVLGILSYQKLASNEFELCPF